MDTDVLKEELLKIIEPLISERGLELVELRVFPRGKAINIDILTDNASGSIDLDQCVHLNRAVCEKLEEEDIIQDSYTVSVASPGLDRPLVSQNDFLRATGRKVRFVLDEAVKNRHEWIGVVVSATKEKVLIRSEDKSSRKRPPFPEMDAELPINKIKKAMQII